MPPGEKPIIVFGQDEAIYNQNASNTSHWVGPNGERPLLPKNNGIGKMISAFQCRETGWGIYLSSEQLLRVNDRHRGTQYFDTKAAADDVGSSNKSPLTGSLFICTFEFCGTNGYWTGSHAIIQVEDCIDSAKEVFGDRVEIVFLFDHSSGHSKKRTNGLDVKVMYKSWVSKIMRPTSIEKGFVGSFYNYSPARFVIILVKYGQFPEMVSGFIR